MRVQQPIFVVDLDDVIADTCGASIQRVNAVFGEALTTEDVTHWDWGETEKLAPYRDWFWGVEFPSEAFQLGHLRPLPGALAGMRKLFCTGEVAIVTARAGCEEITQRWLHYWGFPYDALFFTEDKAAIASGIGASLALDDAPHCAEALSQAGIPTLLFERPYNRRVRGGRITRVRGWEDAMGAFGG